jgi:hypothetical protein
LENIFESDTITIAEDCSSFLVAEQKTTELKFFSGKLYQKILITDYSNGYQTHRWDEIEGQ